MTNFNGKQRSQDRPHFCTHDCEFVMHEMTVGDFEPCDKAKICSAKEVDQTVSQQFLSGSKKHKRALMFNSD